MNTLKFTFVALANNNGKNNHNSKMMTDVHKSLEEKLRPKFSQPGQRWIGVAVDLVRESPRLHKQSPTS
jgi:hypothetical protein